MSPDPGTAGPGRLHPTTRRALALAEEDARGRGHRHIGTGHLLMGVLGTPDGAGAQALARLEVRLHDVHEDVVAATGFGGRAPSLVGLSDDAVEDLRGPVDAPRRRWWQRRRALPMSRCAWIAMALALDIADGPAGTDHVVLGLLRSTDGLAHRLLTARGVTPERLGTDAP